VWCWDFNGWIHEKFVAAEKLKVAQRVNRIIKNTPGAQFVLNNAPQTRVGSGTAQAGSSYGEYMTVLREASVPSLEQTYAPPQNIERPPPFKPQPGAASTPAPTAAKFCSSCGTRSGGGTFCPGCGGKL